MKSTKDRDKRIYSCLNYKAYEDSNKVINLLNGLIFAALFLLVDFKAFLLLPLNVAFYYYMKWLSNIDPFRRYTYLAYAKQAHFYDPWIQEKLKPEGDRPYGFGKGIRF